MIFFEVDDMRNFDLHGMFKRILVNFHLKTPLPKDMLVDLGDKEVLVRLKGFQFFVIFVELLLMTSDTMRIIFIIHWFLTIVVQTGFEAF